MRAQRLKDILLLLALLVAAWLAALALLVARPAASLDEATGVYSIQNEAIPYRWTSNRVDIPIHARTGPTTIQLSFGPARWPGRVDPMIALAADGQPVASFMAPDQIRHYRIALGPGVSRLTIQAPIEQPKGERRWLGATLYGLDATATGLPLRDAARAIVPALALLLLALGFVWSARRGHAIVAGLALLGLLPRVVLPLWTPPGIRPDEVVSLVDAWNIARTGHDHLGNLLPIGAQEAFGDWISPLLTYLEVPAVALFGPAPLVGRLVLAVFGALAAPLMFVLARALRLPMLAAICAGLVAALSPWQMFMSRIALPGGLVPVFWTLCLLAGLLLIQRGWQRDALALALVAGVALYSYPTLKLAAPLLVGWAVLLALLRHGLRAAWRWLPAAGLVALLWLPFVYVTLFNPASSTRLGQAAIRADSWQAWLAAWWSGYNVYFRPSFYLIAGDGDSIRGVAGHGVELAASAFLAVLGLLSLIWRLIVDCRSQIARRLGNGNWGLRANSSLVSQPPIHNPQFPAQWWLLAGAILIAPLPASLTQPSPHVYRAALIAPLYALLAGIGAAALLGLCARIVSIRIRLAAQAAAATLLVAALVWQASGWFRDYARDYPPQQAWENQDGLLEAMQRAVGYAPDFDEVWISYQNINEPYIYLLAAQPMPPAEAQAQIKLTREPGHFNAITSIGKYMFVPVDQIPKQPPMLEAVTDRYGGAAFLLQQWQQDGKRILIVRRME